MSKAEWLLLALDAAGSQGLSPVQLQKSLFLLGKRATTALSEFYEFVPYNYGPFSREIYQDAKSLEQQGLVSVTPGHNAGYREYRITPTGHMRADHLWKRVDPQAAAYLRSLVDWAQRTSFASLVSAIYSEYPEYHKPA